MSELRRLVRNKKIKFNWSDLHKTEFEDLKTALLSSPCRGFPVYEFSNNKISPLILSTDFSCHGFSAILSQIQYGREVLIACSARKTTPTEQAYSSVKGELRGILFGIMKFDKFLSMSNFFFLVTDSMSLKWLISMKTSSKLFMRWATQIFSYNFKILHRQGKIHINADILSREKSILENPTGIDADEQNIHSLFPIQTCAIIKCGTCALSPATAVAAQSTLSDTNLTKFQALKRVPLSKLQTLSQANDNLIYPFTFNHLIQEQSNDRVLSEVKNWVINGLPENTQLFDEHLMYFVELFDLLCFESNVLMLKVSENANDLSKIFGSPTKIIVPMTLIKDVIHSAHSSKHCGHYKFATTYFRVNNRFHWRSMKSDIQKFIEDCVPCNLTGNRQYARDLKYSNLDCSILNQCIHIDLSGPWPKDIRGFTYVLVIVEAATRYNVFVPIRQKKAKIVAEAIFDRYMAYLGIPNHIHSDMGREFSNEVFENLCLNLEIKHSFAPVENHSSNLCERSIRDLVKFFKLLDKPDQRCW